MSAYEGSKQQENDENRAAKKPVRVPSPKEQFEEEKRRIAASTQESADEQAFDEGLREETLKEEAQPVNTGTVVFEAKDFQDEIARKDAAQMLETIDRSAKHLTPAEHATLKSTLQDVANGIHKGAVVLHLVKQRFRIVFEMKEESGKVQKLQLQAMQQLQEASEKLLKRKGALEHLDRQILDVASEAKSR